MNIIEAVKKIVASLALSFAITRCEAQTERVRFIDSVYDERATDIRIFNDSLFVSGFAASSGRWDGLVCVLDKELNFERYVVMSSLYSTQFNSLSPSADTLVLFGASRDPYDNYKRQGLICKFWNDASIGFYPLGGTKRDSFITGACLKKSFYGFGITESYSEDQTTGVSAQDCYVCKTDRNGNLIWQGVYGTEQKDRLMAVAWCSDSASVLLAAENQYYHPNGSTMDSTHVFFVSIDTNGNEMWRRSFMFSHNDGISGVYRSKDKGFYFTGYRLLGPLGADFYFPFIGKMNSSGDVEWFKTFYNDSLSSNSPENERWHSYGARSMLVLNNGDLLLAGIHYTWGTMHSNAFVARFDPSGNNLWRYDHATTDYDNLYRAVEDEQGYIYACGFKAYSANPDNDKDLFIVKLDAYGCPIDTCLMPELSTVEPPTVYDNAIFPNPFTTSLNVQHHQADSTSDVVCNVYNAIGQLAYSVSEPPNANLITIDTNAWANGFYIVELKADGLVERHKAIKQ